MKNISIAIIICTYKREQYVLKNIDILSKYCKDVIKEVYVIDNGRTLSPTLNNNFIHIIPNKNLGGSGGYARGMYEVNKCSECSHILLMDDDIEFTPEVLHKAYERLCNFKEDEKDDWIGFGMVTFDKPNVLYECGAYWNGFKARRNNHGLKLDSDKPLNNKLKYNYSAWWSLIMPITVIERYGYPLPFFIKFDDTEYGLRRQGEEIHFYKDLYVKHESFQKKYNPLIDYYGLRNSLVTDIVRLNFTKFGLIKRYLLNICKKLIKLNFKGAKMANEGLIDFLRGPTIFSHDQLRKIHDKISKKCALYSTNIFLIFSILFDVLKNIVIILMKFKKIKLEYLKSIDLYKSERFWRNI